MQEIPLQLDFVALIMALGLFLGFFVSYFLIKKSWNSNLPNFFMGLLILGLSLSMLEGWLNYTNLIFKVLWATNFSEPLNFIIAPLIYLFVISQFKNFKKERQWLHFVPFIFWLGYCAFFFMQPDAVKYNSNIGAMQMDIPYIRVDYFISHDPMGIRSYVNHITGLSFVIYNVLTLKILFEKSRSIGQKLWNTTNKTLIAIRNAQYHFLIMIAIFVAVKLLFGNSDAGDYFLYLYLSFMLLMTLVQIMNSSSYFNEVSNFLEGPVLKYKKSSLLNKDKLLILDAIKNEMHNEKFFIQSTASLTRLSKTINHSSHHVSQVINEKLGQSFFEMLASYRVEEAKEILRTDLGKKLTIEDIAERVGYNSKSAFNTAFKKFTDQTPSAYRDS
ncbi:helix-turn-helix domain-containing protein [Winogradskyella sp.]|uniref:helix-turn-helix domain-containing protein n=1 Tax=Winogradskyella sp. TaxID=1883156 RepID=UPI0025D89CB7|nr:helix-turn-helix domain-containing protein [Winogradskyella sp.]